MNCQANWQHVRQNFGKTKVKKEVQLWHMGWTLQWFSCAAGCLHCGHGVNEWGTLVSVGISTCKKLSLGSWEDRSVFRGDSLCQRGCTYCFHADVTLLNPAHQPHFDSLKVFLMLTKSVFFFFFFWNSLITLGSNCKMSISCEHCKIDVNGAEQAIY